MVAGKNSGVYSGCHSALEVYLVRDHVQVSGGNMVYTGKSPTISWKNKLQSHDCSVTLPTLPKNVGTHDVVLKAHFTKGVDFVCEIPYTYTITKAPLSVKGIDVSRTYGEVNPRLSYSSVTGFVNGESLSMIGATIEIKCDATEKSPVGEYAYTSTTNAANYEVTSTSGKLTVTKAPLTVTAPALSREYGKENPRQIDLTYTGFKNNETSSVIKTSPLATIEATESSNVGTYRILLSGGDATNYYFASYLYGSMAITPASLTITANNAERFYGDPNPEFTYTCKGFKNGDTAETLEKQPVFKSADVKSKVGSYDIIPSGAVSKNYAITYVSGNLVIKKTPLVITAEDKERLYGDENPQFTFSYDGLKNGETSSVLSTLPSATSANELANVGKYDITPFGADAENYSIMYQKGRMTVNKAPLCVFVNDAVREYGSANPTFTLGYTGFKNGESSYAISSIPRFKTDATLTSNTGTYAVTPYGGEAQNYFFDKYQNGTLTVTPASLTITVDNKTRTYGDPNPDFSFSCKGFKNGDTTECLEKLPTVKTDADSTSKVGNYVLEASGALASNYNITYEKGVLNVKKASLIIKADDKERYYGDENPEFTFTYLGLKNGDTSAALFAKPYAGGKDVQTRVGAYEIVPSGADAENYTIGYQSGTLTIKKAPLKVCVDDKAREYGSGNPRFTATYSGFKNNDTESCFTSWPSFSTDATIDSNVGIYTITASGGSAANYEFSTFVPGTLLISKAGLTISANSVSRLYCENNPQFSCSYSGFRNGEGNNVLMKQPSFTCDASFESDSGEYEIMVNDAEAQNYEIKYVNGKLNVKKRTLCVVAANKSRKYNEENPELTFDITGFVNNESNNVLDEMPQIGTSATKTSDAGTYAISPYGGNATNYDFNYQDGILTIDKAEQEIIWEQTIDALIVGTQLELNAKTTSNLPVEYELRSSDIGSVYSVANKMYLDCEKMGDGYIYATQSGNKNYYNAVKLVKRITVVEDRPYDSKIRWVWSDDNSHASAVVEADMEVKEEGFVKTVTASVNINGAIYSDVKVIDMTGVESARVSNVVCRIAGRTLHVENAEGGSIAIYSLNGICIDKCQKASEHETFEFTEGGVYILKCNDTAVKFLIR